VNSRQTSFDFDLVVMMVFLIGAIAALVLALA
jgi:hypothetical protein